MKSIYEMLKPELKDELKSSARKYSSAKRLKYVLMSKTLWQELTVSELSDLITYSNLTSYKMSPYDFMYGDNILTK
jgi:hypothetical protein